MPGVLVRQSGRPGDAIALAADLRRAGWTANVDLRNRNLSATRRAAERQGYVAIAERVGDEIEISLLAGEQAARYSTVPCPGEVL